MAARGGNSFGGGFRTRSLHTTGLRRFGSNSVFRGRVRGGLNPMTRRGSGHSPLFGEPSSVSNATNDPATADSRVFVGNLNTYQLQADELRRIFDRYGEVSAVSVYKGYGFVQFTNTQAARNASEGENGMTYGGQTIKCNIVSEQRLNTAGRTRIETAASQPLSQDAKRPKMADDDYAPSVRNVVDRRSASSQGLGLPSHISSPTGVTLSKPSSSTAGDGQAKSNSGDKDLLICGRCKSLFLTMDRLELHKKQQCRLRFVCRCTPVDSGVPYTVLDAPRVLTCAGCSVKFMDMWALIQHVQNEHSMPICFEAGGLENVNADVEGGDLEGLEADFDGAEVVPEDHDDVAGPY